VGLLVGDILARAAAGRPGAVGATLGGTSATFADLDAAADHTAAALAGLGVGRGHIVAWWTGTSLRCLDGFVAAARLGAAYAPVSPLLGPDEAAAAVGHLRPRLLVADAARAGDAARIAGGLGIPCAVVGTTGDASTADASMADRGTRDGTAHDLDARTATAARRNGTGGTAGPARARVAEDDPHVVYLTSGTTGAPKGVVVSHRAGWLRSFPGAGTFSLGVTGGGGILTCFPLHHYGGWHYVLEAWHGGHPIHLVERATADDMLATAERWRPGGLYAIPAVWDRLLAAAGPDLDLTSVRQADTGTSATPPDLLVRIRDRLPQATTSVFYGSTEAGHHTTLPDWDVPDHPGSVGRAAPGMRVRVSVDGEVCVTGPTLMTGYLRDPGATAAAVVDGWYRTGDLGHLDADGYLTVTGRVREVIRTGGETVSPTEVEAALRGLPGVRDAAVVGLPDERWGEVVCAALVPDDGAAAPTVEAVRAHVAGRLAPFKQPRRVEVVGAVPRTGATGQVQRTLLRESLARAGRPAAAAGAVVAGTPSGGR